MFPIGDDNSQRKSTPVVTYILIAINVLVFFLELSAGDAFIIQWSVIPRELTNEPGSEAITVLTSMFMHGGWLHLGGNLLYLWIFGDNVEDHFGPAKFLGFYLLCGVAATLAQVAVNPNSAIPNLGASGAIAGVLGAYLVLFPKGQVRVLFVRMIVPMPAIVVIGLWIALQFVNGFGSIANTEETGETGGVAYMAHIGGFVAGFILCFLLRDRGTARSATA
ncbi:MAG: rhomboid family intramembrane serine protease [Rhizobacter sp.]|nr:rhomboid family intramembrane serine protease [Chlorobiales bacterium]